MNAWYTALRSAAEGDLDEDAGRDRPRAVKLVATVGATAFSVLVLELLLTRMYPFFLGDVSAFVAIPVAMYGLSVGAAALHLDPRKASLRAIPVLFALLPLATLGSLLSLFFLFDHVFGLTHHTLQNPPHDALKTATLSLVFLPPFALAGAILSIAFQRASSWVGGLYAADLAGSSLACLLTPLALSMFDLPVVLCLPFWTLWVASLVVYARVRPMLLVGGGVLLGALTFAAARQLVFTEHPDPEVMGLHYDHGHRVTERAHRWNDISRVALLSWEKKGKETTFRVLHDDGVSNVHVTAWQTEPPAKLDPAHQLPFLLDHPPERALALFAGAGRDMIRLHQAATGPLDVTGVEINGLVPELAASGGDPFHLREFYALPDVHLVIAEGRSFLDRDRGTYDLVFAGTNGAQTAVRTGHVRKFLDTLEAVEATLDHLSPDGLVVYHNQPYATKLELLKLLLPARGGPALDQTLIALSQKPNPNPNRADTLLLKPSGFSVGEVDRIVAAAKAGGLFVHYAPGQPARNPLAARITAAPDPTVRIPTDDRPYERELTLEGFSLFPEAEQFESDAYSLDWIKIFTLLLFLTVSGVTVAVMWARPRGGHRLPVWAAAWFLGTGVCYMLTEIGLMAKLELFMGSPLLATSVVLASFLLANAAGSAWVGRRRTQGAAVSPALAAVAAMGIALLTLLVVDRVLVHQLGLPLPVKAVVAVVVTAPLAAVLGMFYPLGVGLLGDRGLDELVPMTFGLATLSAVVGSTSALVAMIDVGARNIVLAAAVGYALVAVVSLAAGRVSARQ